MAWNLTTTEDDAKGSVFSTSQNINLVAATASDESLKQFQEIFLGTFNSNPTQTVHGSSIANGMLYVNTTDERLKYYVGGNWKVTTPTTSEQTNIDAVASNATNINTVAGINANVTTVAGIASNVTTVAGDTTAIGTIASNLSGANTIGTVAGAITNVNAVGGAIANVNTAATNISNINTVAGIDANVTTVAGISGNVTSVANISSDVTSVKNIASNVTTVAGIHGNVTTAAGISSDITSVANISTDVSSLADALDKTYAVTVAGGVFVLSGSNNPVLTTFRGNTYIFNQNDATNDGHPLKFKNSSGSSYTTGVTYFLNGSSASASDYENTTNFNAGRASGDRKIIIELASDAPAALRYYCTVHGNGMGNTITVKDTTLSLVAGSIDKVTTTADNIANINTAAGSISNINTVAGISGNVTTVAGISSDVTNVSNINSAVSTVAGISSNVSTVAGISSNVSTVAGISANISTVAGIASNVTTVASANSNITTVANNITGVNSFADRYRVGSSDPSSSLDEGDLFYNSTTNALKYYNGSSWQSIIAVTTGISNGNIPIFTSGAADNDFLKIDGTSIEGRSATEVLSDIGAQASLTFGISNTNTVKIDSTSVADDEYARFTANGLESRSTAEVLSDIGAAPLASPALTGNPTAPTQATSDNTTKIATTAYVNSAITGAGGITVATARTIAQEEATAIAIALG